MLSILGRITLDEVGMACSRMRPCSSKHHSQALTTNHDSTIKYFRPLVAINRCPVSCQPSLHERSPTTKCRSSFYGGLFHRRPVPSPPELVPQRCPHCGGTGTVTCGDCGGRGRLSRAGYNKRNRVDMARIIGSKWTAMQETLGWRHFRVAQLIGLFASLIQHIGYSSPPSCHWFFFFSSRQVRKTGSGSAFVQLQASCDPAAQLWVSAGNLRDRDLWAAGWLQLSQMADPAAAGAPCRTCSGSGSVPCGTCDGTGAVMRPPPETPPESSTPLPQPQPETQPETQLIG
ncbi:hypothetical protein Agub_g4366, partial [Astrephomene gubernaculifera]